MNSFFLENIRVALQSIRSQMLRTVLTALIISIGIMALVGILTAVDSIKQSISSNFASMGSNTFTIRNRGLSIRMGSSGRRPKMYRAISYDEANRFVKQFSFPNSVTSMSYIASFASTVKSVFAKTNPNIQVWGVSENYIKTAGYEIELGRSFTAKEMNSAMHLAIIGKDIETKLFKNVSAVDKIISVGAIKYKVIGVLKTKGSGMGFGGDKVVWIPINNGRQFFTTPNVSYTMSVMVNTLQEMEIAIGETTGLLRRIRKVPLGADNNFEIIKSDSLASILLDNIKYVTIAATVIGFITLLGAAIGLMNIMLVSVTERTREIGIRKAIGATPSSIKNQFLTEAIVICQLGGLLGIVLGILIGNGVSFLVGAGFIIPWLWIIMGVVLCVLVGVVAGYYPAAKASRLDPIEALRFE